MLNINYKHEFKFYNILFADFHLIFSIQLRLNLSMLFPFIIQYRKPIMIQKRFIILIREVKA